MVELVAVERLHLEPGDVVVYCHPQRLRADAVASVARRLREAFGYEVPVIVLDGGARLQVVNERDLERSSPDTREEQRGER